MVIKGIAQETFAKIILILSGFVLNIALARILGPAEYGAVGIVTSILSVFEIFLTNGVRQSISKFLSSKKLNVKAFWKKSFVLQMVLCLVLIIMGLIFLNKIVFLLNIESYKEFLYLIFLIIPIEGLYYVNQGFLNGLLLYKNHALANSIYSLTRMFLSLIILYISKNGVLAVLLGTLSAYVVSLFFTRIKFIQEESNESISTGYLLTTFLGALFFYLLVNIFLNLDVLLLRGLGLSKIMLGYYRASTSIGSMIYFLFASVLQVSYPLISKLYGNKSITELSKVVNTLLLAIFYTTSLAFVFTSLFSERIIILLFGQDYVYAATVLPWYTLSMGLLSMLIMLGNMMITFDLNKKYLLYLFGFLLIYISLIFVLTPSLGLITPPVTLIFVSVISICTLIKMIKKENQKIFEIKKILLTIVWIIIITIFSLLLNNYLCNYANQYLVGCLILIVYSIISFITIKEIRIVVTNSVSILFRSSK